jgi:hypothetical protein
MQNQPVSHLTCSVFRMATLAWIFRQKRNAKCVCRCRIIWSVNGMHNLRDVPKDAIYDSVFFWDYVVLDLIRNLCAPRRRTSWKGSKSIWTMQVRTVHNPENILNEFTSSEWGIPFLTSIAPQMTSSSLGIWNQNSNGLLWDRGRPHSDHKSHDWWKP